MSDGMNEVFAQLLGDQLKQQDVLEEQTRKAQQDANSQIAGARNEILEAYLSKHRQKAGPEMPEEVKQIVAVLVSQPRLVAPTQEFLRRLVAQINSAVETAINELLGQKES